MGSISAQLIRSTQHIFGCFYPSWPARIRTPLQLDHILIPCESGRNESYGVKLWNLSSVVRGTRSPLTTALSAAFTPLSGQKKAPSTDR